MAHSPRPPLVLSLLIREENAAMRVAFAFFLVSLRCAAVGHGDVELGTCRRGDVGLQQPAARTAQGTPWLRADRRLGRASAVRGRPLQQRRFRVVRFRRRPDHDQPPRRGRHAGQARHGDQRLLSRRILRQELPRRGEGPRPRAQCPDRDRRCDRAGQPRGRAGPGRRQGRPRCAGKRWPRSRKKPPRKMGSATTS